MKIIKSYCYNKRIDDLGKPLLSKLIQIQDEDIETEDYEAERLKLAEKYKCDFVEVAVINIKTKP